MCACVCACVCVDDSQPIARFGVNDGFGATRRGLDEWFCKGRGFNLQDRWRHRALQEHP